MAEVFQDMAQELSPQVLMTMGAAIFGSVNEITDPASGPTTDSCFRVNMNGYEEGSGISYAMRVLLAGPSLDQAKEKGTQLFPDKTEDDIYMYISIKVKDNPTEVIDNIKGMIEAFGLPMEMAEQFGELKFEAGDGEVLIGFKASEGDHLELIKPFLVKTALFGDGSEDIQIEGSFNLATSFDQLLNSEEPIYTHPLKGASLVVKSHMHESTREKIIQCLTENKDQLQPVMPFFPFLTPLFLFKKIEGALELQCTEDMITTIKEMAEEKMPPANMNIKEAMEMVKGLGLPIDAFKPILEMVANSFAGEITFNAVTSTAFQVSLNLPGIDQIITEFLKDE